MTTFLPTDQNSNVIPAMRLRSGGAQTVAATTSASARNASAFNAGTRVISVYATSPVYMNFGDNTVTAATTDHYYPSGVYYDFAIGGDRVAQYGYLAVRAAEIDCTVYISEKE